MPEFLLQTMHHHHHHLSPIQLCRSNGSFNLPNEPAGTSLRFSQLQISTMNPSGSLKNSWSIGVPFSSSIVLFMYFQLKFFNLRSMAFTSSHCHTKDQNKRGKNLKHDVKNAIFRNKTNTWKEIWLSLGSKGMVSNGNCSSSSGCSKWIPMP